MAILFNTKQTKARASKMEERTLAMRNEFWPDMDEEYLWDRKKAGGFTTMLDGGVHCSREPWRIS